MLDSNDTSGESGPFCPEEVMNPLIPLGQIPHSYGICPSLFSTFGEAFNNFGRAEGDRTPDPKTVCHSDSIFQEDTPREDEIKKRHSAMGSRKRRSD
jgi:hypothetical protein